MAGSTMRMNVEAVQAAMSNYDARKNEFQDVVNTIKTTLFDLEGTWTGAAEQAYENQARQLLQNMNTILNAIEGAKGKLQVAINAYEAVESAQKAAIDAVDPGKSDYVV